uniref:Pleckstrin homology domain containing A5 n=1 Tax=Strix occidentalis caurina TaxID=311401 RepID=A0A8D0F4L1_STROC
ALVQAGKIMSIQTSQEITEQSVLEREERIKKKYYTSRSSKKVHNFGKRSNSIKRNPNAPVVRRGWLYKQDSTGMKLWKKRWFVLSDLCLFYYRDEKEEGILGSILLPSFQISVLSAEDHINRKYAFKVRESTFHLLFLTASAAELIPRMKVL